MELSSRILEQIALNTRPIIEEHILVVMDKSTQLLLVREEHLSQPWQTNKKQFRIAVTFLTAYNRIFKVTNKKNNFYFTRTINEDDFSVISILEGFCELKMLNDEIKRIIIKESYFTAENYPILNKPNFSTLGSIIEIKPNFICGLISFLPDDSIRDLLGSNAVALYEQYSLSPSPVDILSFDNIFLECDIAQGKIF